MTIYTQQQLDLLHKVNTHTLPPHDLFILATIWFIPFVPWETKLKLYFYFTESGHTFPLSPSYIFSSLTIFLICGLLVIAFGMLVAKFIFLKQKFREEKVFLEIRPSRDTTQSAFATEELFMLLHNLAQHKTRLERFFQKKNTFSLELVANKKEGIRYLIQTNHKDARIIKKSLLSYLPDAKVTIVSDYLKDSIIQLGQPGERYYWNIHEWKLTNHFVYPLQVQKTLSVHDPIAYITGNMTKLKSNDIMSYQLVLSPVDYNGNKRLAKIADTVNWFISIQVDVFEYLRPFRIMHLIFFPFFVVKTAFVFLFYLCLLPLATIVFLFSGGRNGFLTFGQYRMNNKKTVTYNKHDQAIVDQIKAKVEQPLFETSMRLLVFTHEDMDTAERNRGFIAALNTFTNIRLQALSVKRDFLTKIIPSLEWITFKKRLLSFFSSNPVLSISEIASLYHFPFTSTTQTEDLQKILARDLPAPLSLKQEEHLNIICGTNTYGGEETLVGLSLLERYRHLYVLGATGTGKSTLLLSMLLQDMQKGNGICLVDPHGDLAKSLAYIVPKKREKDFIYWDPMDISFPIRINLLEKTPGLSEDEAELEKEAICESVISIFRKVFSRELASGQDNAHRIEHIFRNAIYTALILPNPTLLTVFDILVNPTFRTTVTNKLTDKRLKDFWINEFGKASSWQKIKMMLPVTARIERFIFSPITRRILEEEKSTINFDDIMDEGKILVCNFSKGKLGEDTAQLLGIIVLAKLQLAALKRARKEIEVRNNFFVYVDEFQNFATRSFVEMMAESRKYGMYLIIAEQSTSQQRDRDLVDIILANTGSVIMFKNANPKDEETILPLFAPNVKKGEIMNLPVHHFYMKISAIDPQEPFSAETEFIDAKVDVEKLKKLQALTRKNYASPYQKQKEEEAKSPPQSDTKDPKNVKDLQ